MVEKYMKNPNIPWHYTFSFILHTWVYRIYKNH